MVPLQKKGMSFSRLGIEPRTDWYVLQTTVNRSTILSYRETTRRAIDFTTTLLVTLFLKLFTVFDNVNRDEAKNWRFIMVRAHRAPQKIGFPCKKKACHSRDSESNQGPIDLCYKLQSIALPTELTIVQYHRAGKYTLSSQVTLWADAALSTYLSRDNDHGLTVMYFSLHTLFLILDADKPKSRSAIDCGCARWSTSKW